MEHDLIKDILGERIGKINGRIANCKKDITDLEDGIALSKEFYNNGSTKSYFVHKSQFENIEKEETDWCESNLGYSPICIFIDIPGGSSSGPPRMVVLFKDDEDLSAYKIMFS